MDPVLKMRDADLLQYDLLTPPQKYLLFTDQAFIRTAAAKPTIALGNLAVIALHTIDKVLQQRGRTPYHYYLQDDASLFYAIRHLSIEPMVLDDLQLGLSQLGIAQLIYRFSCARKFDVRDTRIKQLRLNSWGRFYIDDQQLLSEYAPLVEKIEQVVVAHFEQNAGTYLRLMKILLEPIDAKSAAEIQALNDLVQIKVLS